MGAHSRLVQPSLLLPKSSTDSSLEVADDIESTGQYETGLEECAAEWAIPNLFLCRLMDKLQPTGQKLGRVFNIRSGHLHAIESNCLTNT
jgi:hypothetical protein